ncbi:MotA/TolQ/ExbB proton channel family protein [Algiphilus sp. W345]|uniref:MotA/TolQ/ExbB proton channel family protein n=2 Tax=Banduia mediterranea TaxID=3075609 RepID=A0ABU2WDA8_9GAMM|nr:MotA/TolQ/ExbB proton channel family protein [Algiphilus sp. W345]MDT0495858.1 MotA/TolQ/ExbB proton channel family protein [Algiphilus sp. W345]
MILSHTSAMKTARIAARRLLPSLLLGSALIGSGISQPAAAQSSDELSMQKLLNEVRQGRSRDAADNQKREAAFRADAAQQDRLIREAEQTINQLEARSASLEKTFNANEIKVEEARAQRNERLGALKELFGHLTGAAGDLRSRFANSITTTQYPDRQAFLEDLIEKMNDDTDLPTVAEIEQLWFEMHRELTASGQTVKYPTQVGTDAGREVVRIGLYQLVSNGDYLAYDDATGSVSVLSRQPAGVAGGAEDLQAADAGFTPVGIDPTGAAGGGYLKALIDTPTLTERWQQGQIVGYIITAVGIFGLLVAIWRLLALSALSAKVNRQRKAGTASDDNPLGRVILAGEAHANDDVETLELKLGEAIIKERPEIQRGLSLIKIIAMVAPLMGLLGTVTGMIIVFQAITIYGAGDPKAMAGGISSALVTTVLGLVVAIPMLLLHSWLYGRSRAILHVLEEQTAGIVAERAGR